MHIWFTPCELNYPQPCLFVDNIVVLYCNLENFLLLLSYMLILWIKLLSNSQYVDIIVYKYQFYWQYYIQPLKFQQLISWQLYPQPVNNYKFQIHTHILSTSYPLKAVSIYIRKLTMSFFYIFVDISVEK